jgi:hypothetical protein
MAKVELFNIQDKKEEQRKAEMAMTPLARLELCLDLMDMHFALQPQVKSMAERNNIEWIELRLKNNNG